MITRQFSLGQMPEYPFERDYDINKVAFFDIETTGFSASETYLYLIGCAFYEENSFHIVQWFSEDIREEALLITTFFEFMKSYSVLIHYNGSGFDIPYLQQKCSLLHLDYSFDGLKSIDIYKIILPYKKIFQLASFKQRSLEAFLNIRRKDTFDGGELIQVYQSYLGKKHCEELKKRRNPGTLPPDTSEANLMLKELLQHNEDDVRGLLSISPILNYADLFEKPVRILKAGIDKDRLCIHFETTSSLPIRISFGRDPAHLTAFDKTAELTIRIYEGELKHYYDNYKDYYYLPEEDYAVHKSLAQFVDKNYRVKAKPSTCYIKKQGIFAPQYEPLISPFFKIDYRDKISFLEVHTDFLLREDNLELYVKNMLSHMTAK